MPQLNILCFVNIRGAPFWTKTEKVWMSGVERKLGREWEKRREEKL